MIVYTDSMEGITPERLGGFFRGWPNAPKLDAQLAILQNSSRCIVAIDDATNMVVGFITAITDHVLTAHIPYVEVIPQYRNRGIGRELTQRMMDELKDFYVVTLVCGMGLQQFYGSFGMTPANAMLLRNTHASKSLKS